MPGIAGGGTEEMIPRPTEAQSAACDELQTLLDMAHALSRRLEMTADALRPEMSPLRIVKHVDRGPKELAKAARWYLCARRRREATFGRELFADPCWDIMLDLFASQAEGKRVSVSSACIAANVPATTALRWLTRLEEVGLVKRASDPRDGRRAFIVLSDPACQIIGGWLGATFRENNDIRPGG